MGFELEIEEEIERVALDVDDLVSVVRASAVVLCILKEELQPQLLEFRCDFRERKEIADFSIFNFTPKKIF